MLAGLALAQPAWAHRGGGPNDPCERRIGSSILHLTLYQPEFDPDAEYCDQVPRAGKTVLVVDMSAGALRQTPIALEMMARGGDEAARKVLSVPAKVYRRGMADAIVSLDGSRDYVARVVLGDGTNTIPLSFPIRVAAWYRPFIVPALLVLGLLALTAISVVRYYVSSRQEEDLDEPLGSVGAKVVSLADASRRGTRQARQAALFMVLAIAAMSSSACDQRHRAAEIPNVQVIDDHNQPLSLDSLKGKVVLLDFVHVGCPGVCTTLTSKFGQVADTLKLELGSKLVLLSVTNDPEHDGPAQLLALAKESDANLDGWFFVTGKPETVDRVIKAFGVNNQRLADGSPNHITQVFLVGPDGRARREYHGMTMDSKQVVSHIREALAETGVSG
jgi:cytochrome oxidase Cu insertion factor (SCO1/SenC/PrrC family)